jgi:hypothetical protein
MNNNTPKAVEDTHKLLLWLIPQWDKLPRNRRFTLGDRIETIALHILENLLQVAYSRRDKKALFIQEANAQIAVLRHLWRLAVLSSYLLSSLNDGIPFKMETKKSYSGHRYPHSGTTYQ